MDPIKILLIDDHALFREGVAALLKEDARISIAGEAGSAAEALEAARMLNPDVALVDLGLPDSNGLDLIKKLKEQDFHIHVLILSGFCDKFHVVEAVKNGASGFLTKTLKYDDLINAIHAVTKGNSYYSPEATRQLMGFMNSEESDRPGEKTKRSGFSNRELQVLKLICQGRTNKEIAEALFLSVHTVVSHRRNIFQKAAVSNSAGLVRYASEHGML